MTHKLKQTLAGTCNTHVGPAHPNARLGWQGWRVVTLQVTDCPEGTTPADAIALYKSIWASPYGILTYHWHQRGQNLYIAANRTPQQNAEMAAAWAATGATDTHPALA